VHWPSSKAALLAQLTLVAIKVLAAGSVAITDIAVLLPVLGMPAPLTVAQPDTNQCAREGSVIPCIGRLKLSATLQKTEKIMELVNTAALVASNSNEGR
jgi:hypothetical protein